MAKRRKATAGRGTSRPRRLVPRSAAPTKKSAAKSPPKTSASHKRKPAARQTVAQLKRALQEALAQQTATAEVLRVISRSTFDLDAVLQTLVESAARLCDADKATITRQRDGVFYRAESYGFSKEFMDYVKDVPVVPERGTATGRALLEHRVVQIRDVRADPEYDWDEASQLGDFRTIIGVPMLREGAPLGVLALTRREVRPFSDKQIELITTFADQAAIAIENGRLIDALKARTRELAESLEYQTASSEVLSVISRSPAELQPVLDAIVETAARLCSAEYAFIARYADGKCSLAAGNQVKADHIQYLAGRPVVVDRGSITGRVALERRTIHVPDVLADPEFDQFEWQRVGKQRTVLGVPLMREDSLIGVIILARTKVEPFTERQVDLVSTFADQAVIAIENVRLFDEVQTRTEDLAESLQQQTATAEVLKVISRSTFDLQAVLDTLVESVAKLCVADTTAIARQNGSVYELAATYGHSPDVVKFMRARPFAVNRGNVVGRVVLEGKALQVEDVETDPEFTYKEAARSIGVRTMLGVPLLRQGQTIGVVVLQRRRLEPFTDKQIELAATFADQAVIAIENVRLFDEIQDKSQQLAEASKHKSQFLANMSHELRTPLNAILGYTELILDNIYGETPDKMRAVLERVQRNGRHLLGLINDVLDLSKIEAGQLTLALSNYSLKEVVQGVYSAVEPLAAEKQLALKIELSADLPQGRGDERRLTQVLLNLVGNAIKFTDTGEVVVRAQATNGSFSLSVRDTGPGIGEADQAKLFQEFQQADNSITRAKGGTGLGLAISKRIIELHGGTIWVESRVGQGSTFSFMLPVSV